MTAVTLRQNLNIQKAPAEHSSQQGWLLHDPVTSRYFKIGEQEIGFLRYLSGLQNDDNIDLESEEYKSFLTFLSENNLISCNDESQCKQLQLSILQKEKSKSVKAMFSQYLSLRIPLFKSDKLLTSLISIMRPYLKWPLWVLFLTLAFTAVYMTVNQWGRFSNTFFEMISPSGFVSFVIALIGIKFIHELGHGLAAKYYGCYVPTIGVTFLVFWPVLYTDTSSAWLLPSYRQRFIIALSGIFAEIIVAFIALFLWHFLPSGLLKSICFILATTTWVVSLAINLNPLMRFDGYFLLADSWRTDNLMQRSLALRLWFVRRFLWGLNISPPEQPQLRMVIYGWCSWIYKISLVISISLVVYHFVYKPLGIMLMISMLISSLVKPLFNEIKFIMANINNFPTRTRFISLIVVVVLLILFFVAPIHSRITLPAVMSSTLSQKIYMPFDGQLTNITDQKSVKTGEVIYQSHIPDLLYQLQNVAREMEQLQWQLNQSSIGGEYLNPRPKIKSELIAVTKKHTELKKLLTQSQYTAPFNGVFQPSDTSLKAKDWVKKDTLLGILVNYQTTRIDAYLSGQDRNLLQDNSASKHKITGTFYPNNGISDPIEVSLESISTISVQQINHPELASVNGGSIRVNQMEDNQLVPTTAYYSLRFSSPLIAPNKKIIGKITLNEETYSLAGSLWIKLIALFRQEADV